MMVPCIVKIHEQSPPLQLLVRSKSLDHFERLCPLESDVNSTFHSQGLARASTSQGVAHSSSSCQLSPANTVNSAPSAFLSFDEHENSSNAAREQLPFNGSCKVEDAENVQRNLVLVDGMESSKDSKRLCLDKSSAKQPSLKTSSVVGGTRSKLENKFVPTNEISMRQISIRDLPCVQRFGLASPENNSDGSAKAGPVQRGRFKVRPVLSDCGGGHGDFSGSQTEGGRQSPSNKSLVDIMAEHSASMSLRMDSLERAVITGNQHRQMNTNTRQSIGGSARDFPPKGNSTAVDSEVCVLGVLSTLVDRMKTEMENAQCKINNISIELRALKSKNKQLEHLYEEQKKKTTMTALRLNEEREKVQSLKQQLKGDGQPQMRPSGVSTSSVDVKQDEVQGCNTTVDNPDEEKRLLHPTSEKLRSFESISSLGISHDKSMSPHEVGGTFFTPQQHGPLNQYTQQHNTAQQHLHHITSPLTPGSSGHNISPYNDRLTKTHPLPAFMTMSDGKTDSNAAEPESLSQSSSNGLVRQLSSSTKNCVPSGLPLLSGKCGTQPKPNATKQGNTAGAAISQMASPP